MHDYRFIGFKSQFEKDFLFMDPKQMDELKAQKIIVDYNADGKGHTINTGSIFQYEVLADWKVFREEGRDHKLDPDDPKNNDYMFREGVEEWYEYIFPNYGEPTDLIPPD